MPRLPVNSQRLINKISEINFQMEKFARYPHAHAHPSMAQWRLHTKIRFKITINF